MDQANPLSIRVGQHEASLAGTLRLPLVTLFVASWNYGRYIGATIDSIRAQNYPRLEVVIVENASTDDSRDVIARHVGSDPRFRVILSDRNYGHLGAFFHFFDQLHGEFIASVDSDDVLQADYVSVHVQTHLGLRAPVAFTSSNVFEITGDGTVLAGSRATHGSEIPKSVGGLRPIDAVPRIPTVSDEAYHELSKAVRSVPRTDAIWRWAPGTANMYRRQVLAYGWRPFDESLAPHGCDAVINTFCHMVAGSALIDLPLSFYRVHGGNDFATGVALPGTLAAKPGTRERIQSDRRAALELFLVNIERLAETLGAFRFWEIVDQITRMATMGRMNFITAPQSLLLFATYYQQLVNAFGEEPVLDELRKRLGPDGLAAVLTDVYGRPPPVSSAKKACGPPKRRLLRRLFRSKKS